MYEVDSANPVKTYGEVLTDVTSAPFRYTLYLLAAGSGNTEGAVHERDRFVVDATVDAVTDVGGLGAALSVRVAGVSSVGPTPAALVADRR